MLSDSIGTDETPAYSGEGEVLDVMGGPTSGKIIPEMDTHGNADQ